ncbi:MAG: alanine--glyoxylate aminotransferase family protein [archaeon]
MAMTLFIPGPVEVDDEILHEMSRPQIGHRSASCKELLAAIRPGLKKLFSTDDEVLISTSSGSGFWEAAIRSCVNKRVLHTINGAFSKKWADVSERCGREVERITYDWGKAVKPEDVDKALSEGKYEAFCMVHNETSTGVASDLAAISVVMAKHPDVLWFVDAVSSFAGISIETKDLGIDFCLASSQKALALPPGIAVAAVSGKAFEKAETVEGRGYYFDILELKKMIEKDQTPYTPSIPHLYALRCQLERIDKEGLARRYARHRELAKTTREWIKVQGFSLFSEEGFHSDTVSCIENTKGVDFAAIKTKMAEKGYAIDTGYRKLNEKLDKEGKNTTFRIPHMGDLTLEGLRTYLDALESVI